MTALTNLLADIPADMPDEVFQTLVSTEAVRVERIISLGHTSPAGHWLDQARARMGGGAARRGAVGVRGRRADRFVPGAFVNIPAHRRHRVVWTAPDEPTIWLAIHYQ